MIVVVVLVVVIFHDLFALRFVLAAVAVGVVSSPIRDFSRERKRRLPTD